MEESLLYTGDNLHIMNGMNSEFVDLIYTDPPFNSKRAYAAPIGSKAAGAAFNDIWTWQDVDEECLEKLYKEYPHLVDFIDSVYYIHSPAMASYLTFMAQRILEMHRILKDTGSFYLHIDPTASHYLKIVCDRIFGRQNFINEIIWGYKSGGATKSRFSKKHDIILFYRKTTKNTFNAQYYKRYMLRDEETGKEIGKDPRADKVKYYQDNIGTYRMNLMRDIWDDIGIISPNSKTERTGYPTQKPLKLLHRIIEASSNKGDIVFDPFCGCATACVAAQELDRKWIGIDVEKQAKDLVVQRLSTANELFSQFTHLEKPPVRTDIEILDLKKNKAAIKEQLYKQQKGICVGCENEYLVKDFHIDHEIPKSKGGQDNIENLQLLCKNCNSVKGDRPMQYLLARINRIREVSKGISYG